MKWIAITLVFVLRGLDDIPRPELKGAEPPVIVRVEEAAAEVEASRHDADAWGRYAIVLQAHGCDQEAEAAYIQAQRRDPAEFRWPYFRAVIAAKSDPVASLELLDRALELDASYGPAHERRAVLLDGLGRDDEVREEFREAIRLLPGSPSAHLHLGQFELKHDHPMLATRHLETARERWPDSVAVMSALARVYVRRGDRDRAREFADAARRGRTMPPITDPRLNEVADAGVQLSSFTSRAENFLRAGQPTKAVQELKEALRLGHDPGHVHGALARVYLHLGEYGQCTESGRLALTAGHDTTALRFAMGSALLRMQRLDDADRSVEAGLALSSTDSQILRLRGQIAAARGRDANAIELWDEALAVRDDPVTRRLRADALSRLGRHAEAIAALSALASSPLADMQTLIALGEAHRAAGNQIDALAAYDRAEKVATAPLPGRIAAVILIEQRRFAEAKVRLEDLRRQWPQNPGVANDLAWLLATCPDADIRNGPAALGLILPIVRQTNRRGLAILDTYAAVLAENGQFAEATAVMDEALALLPAQASQDARSAYNARRSAYAAGRRWRTE